MNSKEALVFLSLGIAVSDCNHAYASCSVAGQKLFPMSIDEYLTNLLASKNDDFASKLAARELSFFVSRYVEADVAAVGHIQRSLSQMLPWQRKAIGEGLYRAAEFCRTISDVAADKIEIAMKAMKDKHVNEGYRRLAKETPPPALNWMHQPEKKLNSPSNSQIDQRNPESLELSDPLKQLRQGR